MKAYNAGEIFEPGCEKCDWWKIQEKQEWNIFWKTTICSCEHKCIELNEIIFNLEKSGISEEQLSLYKLEKFNGKKYSIEDMIKVMNNDSSKYWLYFSGTPGTGKTYQAFVLIYTALSSGIDCLHMNVPKLMDLLRPSDKDTGRYFMEKCIETEFLVLDDLWQEKCSEWVLERLYIILNERYENKKVTIITSNTSIDKLFEKIKHPAILSRIKWTCIEIPFIWNDSRITS